MDARPQMVSLDKHEEQLMSHTKNLDTLGRIIEEEPARGSDDEENDDEGIDSIFKAIIEKNLSQCTLPTIIRLLHTQINTIARDISRIKKRAAKEKS